MSFSDNSRLAAFELLMNVESKGSYANLEMPALITKYSLSGRDASFATELGYGTLRMQGLYDYFIAEVSDRPLAKIDQKVLNVLRLGVHQLITLATPAHAATSETVELGKHVAGRSTSGFINAVMRKIPAVKLDLLDKQDVQSLSVMYSHPEWIVQSFQDLLGSTDELVQLLAANNSPVKPDFVAWPGKSHIDEFSGLPIPGAAFGVTCDSPPTAIQAVRERRAGVQDRGSQVVAQIFLDTARGVEANLHWLDLCAGPGGKAAYIYNWLHEFRPGDDFLANEISEHRARLVSQVIPPEKISIKMGQEIQGSYDRILIDAPCSGLGALRRRPESRWRKKMADLRDLVDLQRQLLDRGSEVLTPGGVIAYVTCSPHVAETRLQVSDFLHRHKEFKLVTIEPFLPSEFTNALLPNGTVQMWPHKNHSDAMFMALLEKGRSS